jgi:hypothetical protein
MKLSLNIKPLNILIACVVLSLSMAVISSAQDTESSPLDASLTAQDVRGTVVIAGTTAGVIPFLADPQTSGGDILDIVTTNANATISLVLPSGLEINSSNAAAQGFGYQVLPNGTMTNSPIPSVFSTSGTHIVIKFPASSVPGNYQIKIASPPQPDDYLVVASYFSSSTVHAGLVTDSPHYQVGDRVVISGLLFDGSTPITGASVTAAIRDPSQPEADPVLIVLLDSGEYDDVTGDGIYTGSFTVDQIGEFAIAMKATGASRSGTAFSRVTDTSFKVTKPLASFASFQDASADDDANGLIDRVIVTATVNVRQPGNYKFNVTLGASNGAEATASAVAVLQVGIQQISVSFPARELYNLNANGPYQIKNALLTFQNDQDNPVASFRELAGSTAAYQLSSIQPPSLYFPGEYWEWGEDRDGNGKYNSLVLEAKVLASTPGGYDWSASLVDSLGNTIERINGSSMLRSGSNYIDFKFDGYKIGQNGVDGPYSLQRVTISGAGDSANVHHLFSSEPYPFTEFEGGTAPSFAVQTVTATPLGGNGNATVDPGEDGSLRVKLINNGGYARNVNATLTTSTPGVTVINGISAYPDVPPSLSDINLIPLTFRTSGGLPSNTLINFTLIVTSGSGGAQTLPFVVQAGSATTVRATETVVTSSAATSTYGQQVTLAASVSSGGGTPTGGVEFFDGPISLGTADLINGHASLSVSTLNAGSHSVTAIYAGADIYSSSTSAAFIQSVNRAAPTIDLTAGTFTYDGNPHQATGSVTGINGEDLGNSIITYNGASLVPVNAGSYEVVASFIGNANYEAANATKTLVINKATPSISWSHPLEIVYGSQLGSAQLNATTTIPGVMTYTPAAGVVLNAGAGQSLSVSFAPNNAANYNSATASVTIDVKQAPLTITVNNVIKPLGAPNPAFTVTYSGFVAGQGADVLAGTLSFATSATVSSPGGNYPITPSGVTSSNYQISFVSGTLSVAYGVNPLYDMTKAVMSGSTIPIKLQLTDVNGINMSSANIVVHAVSIMRVSANTTETLADSGNANPDSNFRYDSTLGVTGGYIFNLSTIDYPPGTFVLSFIVGNGTVIQTVEFRVRQ